MCNCDARTLPNFGAVELVGKILAVVVVITNPRQGHTQAVSTLKLVFRTISSKT